MSTMPRSFFDRGLRTFYDWVQQGKTDQGTGLPAGVGVEVSEYGSPALHRTVFTFTNQPIALTDAEGVVAHGGLKIYDFPVGAILFLGAVADLAITKSSAGVNDTFDGDFSLGTVIAAGDATLSSTEANLIPSTATPQAVAGATTAKGKSTGTESGAILDGTGTAIDAFLNFVVDDADHDVAGTPANLIVNGTLTITWANLGDH